MHASSEHSGSATKFLESSTQVIEEDIIEFENKGIDHSALQDTTTIASKLPPNRQSLRREHFSPRRGKVRRRQACASMSCSCACHRVVATSKRFWAIEYTPLAVLLRSCDTGACTATKYGFNFRIALSQLGIKRAVIAQCQILSASEGYSIRSALKTEHVVPYTSPGFEVIWKLQTDQISLEEAQSTLVQLFRSDEEAFREHVNPGGVSYIEVSTRIVHSSCQCFDCCAEHCGCQTRKGSSKKYRSAPRAFCA